MSYSASSYPYDTIVRITDTIGGQSYQGSGVLIAPNEVLTASHAVYIQGVGTATNIVVTPGYSNGSSPYGSATGISIHYSQIDDANGMITQQQSQNDYAVIHLATSFNLAGTMGIEPNFAGGLVNISGYPGTAGGAQFTSMQTVVTDPSFTLLDSTAIGEGSSGGPLWVETASGPEVVGLVSSESEANSTGYNVLITTAVFNQIEAWVAQDIGAAGVPAITGTVAAQPVTDETTIAPFSKVSITDSNSGQTEMATVTLSAAINGTLTNLGGGSYNNSTGVYSVTGTAVAVTTALDGLIFNPTARQGPASQTITTGFTIAVTDTAGLSATDATTSVIATETGSTGLIGALTIGQQLELIYIGYFDRAADGPGFSFWEGQNVTAQAAGETAGTALTNIANSFAPQPEAIALYPFLAGTSSASQADLATLISDVYENLFGRAPDPTGEAYWLGQLASGAVTTGAAILAIANGATGTDANEVTNKITVALDFTTRTTAAGLSGSGSSSSAFLAAARSVLTGVDGTTLNDASVTAGENATTAFISGATTGSITTVAAASMPSPATGPITISASNSVIDPGVGGYTIQFLTGTSADTLMLHTGGMDQVSGFDPTTDVLNVSSLLSEANVNLNGDVLALSNYLSITDQGGNAFVNFDPTGQSGGGSTVAVLQGLGGVLTGLGQLLGQGPRSGSRDGSPDHLGLISGVI